MIIIILFIMIGSMILLLVKMKNMLSLWMLTLYIGCFFVVLGYMYFFSKMGGLSNSLNVLLFINKKINRFLMYSPIPLDKINFYIIFGRSIFMFSNLFFAIEIYYNKRLRENLKWFIIVLIIPILNLIAYSPKIYRKVFLDHYTQLNCITRVFIIVYSLLTIFLIVLKYSKINIPWIKKQLKYIILAVISINIIFYSFGFLGTLQIVDPNTLGYLSYAFASLQSSGALISWVIIITISIIFTSIGFVSLWNYAKIEKQIGKPDLHIERKLKTAHMGARIFAHGIKNHLLVNRIILKKIIKELDNDKANIENIKSYIYKIEQINEWMFNRIDILYKNFKSNAMSLKPHQISNIIKEAMNKINGKYENISIEVIEKQEAMILADISHLSEAIYNIIINGIEAIFANKNINKGYIHISYKKQGNKIVIMITDNGIGIPKDKLNSIFDPFYTDKNMNTNWGVGLSYAQQIVDNHFGYIRINSEVNKGTTFFIFLPIYKLNLY